MDSAGEVDAEIILHLPANARSDLRSLPPNVRLVDWLPMGVFLNGADGFIHHGGAGNTLTALHAGIPQIVFGRVPTDPSMPAPWSSADAALFPVKADLRAA